MLRQFQFRVLKELKNNQVISELGQNLEKDLTHALSLKNRLVFVDVITDETENVYPMIMNGKGHHEMHLAPSANEDIELA